MIKAKKYLYLLAEEFEKHSPEILTGFGIAGMFTAVIFSVKATPKAIEAINKKKEELQKEKLSFGETIKATWKYYVPTAATLAVSTACVIGSDVKCRKHGAAIAAAYAISETDFSEYKDKVKETLGENKEKDIQAAIDHDRIVADPPQSTKIIYTGKGDRLFQIDGQYFESSLDYIQKSELELCRMMRADQDFNDGFISKNDVHQILGVECTDDTDDDIGWTLDSGYIGFTYDPILLPNGDVCTVVHYKERPNTIRNSRNFHLL